jgi:hypothetical protein
VADTWAKTHAVGLAPTTARHYASLHDLHIEPYLGELKLTELTPEVIGRWEHLVCARTPVMARRLRQHAARVPRYGANHGLMELGGLEPPTSWVRSRRSPN